MAVGEPEVLHSPAFPDAPPALSARPHYNFRTSNMNIFTSSKAFTMLPIEIGLGDAHLQSRGSGISVELKSSAQFASSAEDDIDQLRQRLTSALLTDREDGKPWIRRGDSFKLVLSLHLQDVLDTAGRDEVVHILTGNVQSAEVIVALSGCRSQLTMEFRYGLSYISRRYRSAAR